MSFLCKRCSKYLFIHHEWIFSCFLNWNGKANALWHIWHSKTLGLSPWVLARWYLRWFFWTNFFPQWLQLCWREGAWINRCSFKLRNSPKFLSQIVQVHGLSPEWVVLMWYFNLVLSLNTLLHALHFLLTLSHTLEISWFCNNFWLKKFFRQILHENWILVLDLFLCIFLSFCRTYNSNWLLNTSTFNSACYTSNVEVNLVLACLLDLGCYVPIVWFSARWHRLAALVVQIVLDLIIVE